MSNVICGQVDCFSSSNNLNLNFDFSKRFLFSPIQTISSLVFDYVAKR